MTEKAKMHKTPANS